MEEEKYYKLYLQFQNGDETLYVKVKDNKIIRIFSHSRYIRAEFKETTIDRIIQEG